MSKLNKQFLIGVLVLFVVLYFVGKSTTNDNSKKITEEEVQLPMELQEEIDRLSKGVEEVSFTNDDIVQSQLRKIAKEEFDSINMVYRNFKYGVFYDFPDHWSFLPNRSQSSLVMAASVDSAISGNIIVTKLDVENANEIGIWEIWDNDTYNMKNLMQSTLEQSVGGAIYNYEWRKVYLSYQKAIEIKFQYNIKSVDLEYVAQGIIYMAFKDGYSYTVRNFIPKFFYDINKEYYNRIINGFEFLNSDNTELPD